MCVCVCVCELVSGGEQRDRIMRSFFQASVSDAMYNLLVRQGHQGIPCHFESQYNNHSGHRKMFWGLGDYKGGKESFPRHGHRATRR